MEFFQELGSGVSTDWSSESCPGLVGGGPMPHNLAEEPVRPSFSAEDEAKAEANVYIAILIILVRRRLICFVMASVLQKQSFLISPLSGKKQKV